MTRDLIYVKLNLEKIYWPKHVFLAQTPVSGNLFSTNLLAKLSELNDEWLKLLAVISTVFQDKTLQMSV